MNPYTHFNSETTHTNTHSEGETAKHTQGVTPLGGEIITDQPRDT